MLVHDVDSNVNACMVAMAYLITAEMKTMDEV